jgi:hypothetical protein
MYQFQLSKIRERKYRENFKICGSWGVSKPRLPSTGQLGRFSYALRTILDIQGREAMTDTAEDIQLCASGRHMKFIGEQCECEEK